VNRFGEILDVGRAVRTFVFLDPQTAGVYDAHGGPPQLQLWA
jgi:hypothetical protein